MNEQMNLNVHTQGTSVAEEREFISKVYLWMTLGLLITAAVAVFVAASPQLMYKILVNQQLFYGFIIAELVLVWYMSARVHKMSIGQLSLGMVTYAALNGITLSVILWAYTSASIYSTFFITAGTFGVMSLIGYTTKKDLSAVGEFMFMGLIGIILASLVNYFFQSSAIYWIVTYMGVVIFAGLTAYDSQKLKNLARMQAQIGVEEGQKMVMMGALTLYLDFINLFLFLIRIVGRRK